MKPNSKFREICSILVSGITGAFALNGICIVLFLIGFGYRNEFISFLYQKTFARCSFEDLFIATSSIGFILGIIARRRFLNWKKEIILIAVFSIPLIFGTWLIHNITIHFSLPHSVKLADCTNSVVNIQLKVPQGHGYQFELLTPGAQTKTPNGSIISSYKFSGHIHISKGTSLVADLSIVPDKVEFIESGFILGGVDSQNAIIPLGQFLQPQEDYDIQITLNPLPPTNTSLWLYWLQSPKDKDK